MGRVGRDDSAKAVFITVRETSSGARGKVSVDLSRKYSPCQIRSVSSLHLLDSVTKLERDEYFNVKAMFSHPDQCVRAAMYAPFKLENITSKKKWVCKLLSRERTSLLLQYLSAHAISLFVLAISLFTLAISLFTLAISLFILEISRNCRTSLFALAIAPH